MVGVKHRPHVAAPHDMPRSRLRSLWSPWAAQMTAVATSAHRFRTPEKMGHVGSKKLDVPRHFFGGRNAVQEDQIEHDLPQSSVSRWPKDDPCVRPAGLGLHDEVTVARHQHAALRMRKRQLLQVGSALEFVLDGGRHIDSPQPEASGNGGVDMLVKVVLDFHPASLAINPPRHGCGPGTRNLLPLSAVMQPRHHPESAGQSDFGCRGNTQGLRTRRRASGAETTPQSRRVTAPPRSRRRRPGPGSACPQLEVSPRRCLGSLRCGIFQTRWPCRKFRTKAVRSQSRKRNRYSDAQSGSSARKSLAAQALPTMIQPSPCGSTDFDHSEWHCRPSAGFDSIQFSRPLPTAWATGFEPATS